MPVSTRIAQRANGEPKRAASSSSTAADSLPVTRAATVRRSSIVCAKGTSAATASSHPPTISQRRRTTVAASRSNPAIFPQRAIATGGKRLVLPTVHRGADLPHPLAIPDLGDRVIADVPEYFLARPVMRAQEHAAVVENVGCGERSGAVTEPGARCATANAVKEGHLLARQPELLVELGKGTNTIVRGVDEYRNPACPPTCRKLTDFVGIVAELHHAHEHARVGQLRVDHALHTGNDLVVVEAHADPLVRRLTHRVQADVQNVELDLADALDRLGGQKGAVRDELDLDAPMRDLLEARDAVEELPVEERLVLEHWHERAHLGALCDLGNDLLEQGVLHPSARKLI